MNESMYLYLQQILQKYQARDLSSYALDIVRLEGILKTWANNCFVELRISGSRSKKTAISLASDVDYLISLSNNCNESSGGLKSIYNSLYTKLGNSYSNVRKQNVSIRINIRGLEVDVTPARKLVGNTNLHNLYVSKSDTWTQTNIQKHIIDIANSGRINEIKLLKIWRELNQLDFPSIYLEYLLINNILLNKSKEENNLESNMSHVFIELARDSGNPLFSRIVDPGNSNNILSDLLTRDEKHKIISTAKQSIQKSWREVLY